MGGISSRVHRQIDRLMAYLPRIRELDPCTFDEGVHDRLMRVEQMSRGLPSQRTLFMERVFEECGEFFDRSPLMRRVRRKPLGYDGDYQMIDWVYTRKISEDPREGPWDEFYLRQPASDAVRNRKSYLVSLFGELCRSKDRGVRMLNLACGPCRDVAEAVAAAGTAAEGALVHDVDADERAVEHGIRVTSANGSGVTYRWDVANALRFRGREKYDLVWSSGLFDYLNDRVAAALLSRMWRWASPGGRIVVGNFHPDNPSRLLMEWTGRWFLIHRTEADLRRLCGLAGIPGAAVSLEREPLGVCGFCVVTR